MLRISIVILLLIVWNQSHALAASKNAKNVRCDRFDDMFNEFSMVASDKRQFPSNTDEFLKYCKKNNDLANQLNQSIKQCFNETMRNIASLVLYSYRQRTRSLCRNRNSKRAREYMNAGPCLNQHKHRLSRCIDLTAMKIGQLQEKPNNMKFPHLCCENIQFQRCVDKIPAGNCKEKINIYAESAQSIMNGFVDRQCGEYNADTDRCDELINVKNDINNEKLLNKTDTIKPSFIRNVAQLISSIE